MRRLGCPVPENLNPLSPNGFKFSLERIPDLTYFIQEIEIPAISLPNIGINTPFSKIPITGETMRFDTLTIKFLIDGDMKNYIALFRWLRGMGFPQNNEQYVEQIQYPNSLTENSAAMSDGTLEVLGNTNSTIQTIQFVDCVITSLNALTFLSTSTDVNYLIGHATFEYSYYDFI
jgi:hypothetical protein